MMEGDWRVEVITAEGLVLGVIDFHIHVDSTGVPRQLTRQAF